MNRSSQCLTMIGACSLFGFMALVSVASAKTPRFINEPLHSPNAAPVLKVAESLSTDIVFLDGGREQGLRRGMVCEVTRGSKSIGEIIIIESNGQRSAGLILELVDNSFIQSGDFARIKTLQNS